jgi:hypothetical protein
VGRVVKKPNNGKNELRPKVKINLEKLGLLNMGVNFVYVYLRRAGDVLFLNTSTGVAKILNYGEYTHLFKDDMQYADDSAYIYEAGSEHFEHDDEMLLVDPREEEFDIIHANYILQELYYQEAYGYDVSCGSWQLEFYSA